MLRMMADDGVDRIQLPLMNDRLDWQVKADNGANPFPEHGMDNLGDGIEIDFDFKAQSQRAGPNKPWIVKVDELKIAYVTWLKENNLPKLECKIEKYLKERGHEILWTPPYCPDLQPIELFWAGGKNYAASMYFTGRKMQDIVKHLRQGWYGNGKEFPGSAALKLKK